MAVLTSGAIGVIFLSERFTKAAEDDAPVPGNVASSSETEVDQPREPAGLERPETPERLLAAGEAVLADLYRAPRDRVHVPRESAEST